MDRLIEMYIDRERFEPSIFTTEYAGHGAKLAKEALKKGNKIIIAVGGDGTVNEIASVIVNHSAILGIIPCGSGNGLARQLGIPINVPKSIELINHGKVKVIDGGQLNNQWFFCTCGIGFDAKIGLKFSKSETRGFLAYLKIVLGEIKNYRPKKYRFNIDGEDYVRKAFLITIANATQFGNNAHIAPKARIDDGLFDICIVKPFPWFSAPMLGLRLFNKSLESSKYHEIIHGRTIKFKKPKKKYTFHFDGEPARYKKEKITISMHPLVLNVIVPAKMV